MFKKIKKILKAIIYIFSDAEVGIYTKRIVNGKVIEKNLLKN